MGLDQYAFTLPKTQKIAEVDFNGDLSKKVGLHYWRKHPNLHGWLEGLYREKGGCNEDFNLSTLRLNASDLDRLESAILRRRLPDTDGCFSAYRTAANTRMIWSSSPKNVARSSQG